MPTYQNGRVPKDLLTKYVSNGFAVRWDTFKRLSEKNGLTIQLRNALRGPW